MRVSLRTTGHGSPAHRILAGSKGVVPMLRGIGWRGFYRNDYLPGFNCFRYTARANTIGADI